jgi:hypothetical protein
MMTEITNPSLTQRRLSIAVVFGLTVEVLNKVIPLAEIHIVQVGGDQSDGDRQAQGRDRFDPSSSRRETGAETDDGSEPIRITGPRFLLITPTRDTMEPMIGLLQFLAWSILFKGINAQLTAYIGSRGRYRQITAITLIDLGANLLLNLILVPRFGAPGAALAVLATEGMNTLMQGSVVVGSLAALGRTVSAQPSGSLK